MTLFFFPPNCIFPVIYSWRYVLLIPGADCHSWTVFLPAYGRYFNSRLVGCAISKPHSQLISTKSSDLGKSSRMNTFNTSRIKSFEVRNRVSQTLAVALNAPTRHEVYPLGRGHPSRPQARQLARQRRLRAQDLRFRFK